MQISAELSLYPLSNDYKPEIKNYIALLNKFPELDVKTNALSTEIFGDYDIVMRAIQTASKTLFEQDSPVVLIAKYLNKDRRGKNE